MPKKGENIRKRKDGRWEGRYKAGVNENGTTKYGSVYGHTYSEVKSKLYDIKAKLLCGEITKYKEWIFKDAVFLWLESNRIRLKGATENKYRYMIETHILPELGHQKISSLTSASINAFLNHKLCSGRLNGKGGLSPSYVRTLSIIINSVLSFAAKEELCRPIKTPIFKPRIPRNEMQVLSPHVQKQFEDLILADLDLTKLGTYICLQTGLRVGEICALTWEDIDFNSNIIHIRHTVSRVLNSGSDKTKTKLIIDKPKTEASVRDIPIASALLPVLKKMQSHKTSSYVVSDQTGFVSTRTFDNRYRRMLIQLGIVSINFHALRHTFATRCVDAGVDIKSLSEILGHSSVSITLDTYVHPSMEVKKNQIEKLYLST